MAVTLDAWTYSSETGPESFSAFNHTTAALTNGYAQVIAWMNNATTTVTACSFGGQACARIGTSVAGPNSCIEVWGLKNPPNNGSEAVSITFSTSDYFRAAAMTWDGVDQTTPVSGETSNTGNGESASISVTSTSGNVAVGTLGEGAGKVTTADQTRDYPTAGVNQPLCGEHTNGSGSTTLSWSWTGATDWFAHGFSLNAAGGGPTNNFMWSFS